MGLRLDDITTRLEQEIAAFEAQIGVIEVGAVLEVGDGIARVSGLRGAMASELLEFPPKPGRPHGIMGIAFNLEHDNVGVIILGEYAAIEEGDAARTTGRIMSVPVGEKLVGRVVNALGQPIDGKGPVECKAYRPIERIAPNVTVRQDGFVLITNFCPILFILNGNYD